MYISVYKMLLSFWNFHIFSVFYSPFFQVMTNSKQKDFDILVAFQIYKKTVLHHYLLPET